MIARSTCNAAAHLYNIIFADLDSKEGISGMTAGRVATACEMLANAMILADSNEEVKFLLEAVKRLTGNDVTAPDADEVCRQRDAYRGSHS